MPLPAGARLGPYEIVSPLGDGGMGVVYRARDARLNRDIAIKVLPDLFATDAERLARFTREAQTLASLNHPNIAQIYRFEQSGETSALVMELVEGDDLNARTARGPLPRRSAADCTADRGGSRRPHEQGHARAIEEQRACEWKLEPQ